MWLIFLILLSASTAIEIFDEDCNVPAYTLCRYQELPNFPRTPEELDVGCRVFTEFIECIIDREERCDGDAETIESGYHLLFETKELCEGSISEVVRNNIQCIWEFDKARTGRACFRYTPSEIREEIENRIKNLKKQGVVNFVNEDDVRACFQSIRDEACFSAIIGRSCGEDLAEASLKFHLEFPDMNIQDCPEEVEVEELLQIFFNIYKMNEQNEK